MIPRNPRITFDPDPLPEFASDIAPAQQPWRRILVAIDRADHPALAEAVALARALHASITLVNVIFVSANAMYSEAYVRSADPLDPMRTRAADILTQAASTVPFDIPLELVVREGDITREILRAVESSSADALFVGARPRGTLRRLLFGTLTNRLLARARCPVIVVSTAKPENPPVLQDHRILVHTN